jgi:hypothetical protein
MVVFDRRSAVCQVHRLYAPIDDADDDVRRVAELMVPTKLLFQLTDMKANNN